MGPSRVAKAIHDYYRQYAIPAESAANMVTIGESVPGYEASVWYGIAAPKAHHLRSSRSSIRR